MFFKNKRKTKSKQQQKKGKNTRIKTLFLVLKRLCLFFFSDTKLKCFPKIDSSKTSHREYLKHEHSTKRKSFLRQTQTFENVHTKL